MFRGKSFFEKYIEKYPYIFGPLLTIMIVGSCSGPMICSSNHREAVFNKCQNQLKSTDICAYECKEIALETARLPCSCYRHLLVNNVPVRCLKGINERTDFKL